MGAEVMTMTPPRAAGLAIAIVALICVIAPRSLRYRWWAMSALLHSRLTVLWQAFKCRWLPHREYPFHFDTMETGKAVWVWRLWR
jgi:hypothetical protein